MVHPARILVVTLASAALFASAPAVSVAQTCQAPPGTSAVEQYCESVPTADSNDTTPQAERQRAAKGPSTTSALSPSTRSELADAGDDGSAVAQFAESAGAESMASAPENRGEDATNSGTESASDGVTDEEVSANPLRAVAASIGNGATVGDRFGWLMLACTVLVAGMAWLRHRGGARS